jgi:hypothetical protein
MGPVDFCLRFLDVPQRDPNLPAFTNRKCAVVILVILLAAMNLVILLAVVAAAMLLNLFWKAFHALSVLWSRMDSVAVDHVKALVAEAEKLKKEVDFFKEEVTRTQFGRMYQRAGGSIYAKLYVDKQGNVLVTDNLFCRMVADGSVRQARNIHLLPDCIFGYGVIKFSRQHMAQETTFCVKDCPRGVQDKWGNTDAQRYNVVFSSGALLTITLRTGVPNDL